MENRYMDGVLKLTNKNQSKDIIMHNLIHPLRFFVLVIVGGVFVIKKK